MDIESRPQTSHAKANALFYGFLMILLLSLFVWGSGELSKRERVPPWNSSRWEKLAISDVSFGSSPASLSLTVVGIQGGKFITINEVIIKNMSGEISQIIHMDENPAVVPVDGNVTTVHVNLTSPLSSGKKYTLTLATTKGSSFVSPTFTGP